MSSEKRQRIRIYSYTKVWKKQFKIYSFGNLVLPVPIDLVQIGYFILAIIISVVISAIFPFLSAVPVAIKFIMLPYLISQFLLRKKLDGKNPIKYFVGILFYLFEKGSFLNRFAEHSDKEGDIKIYWNCSQGKGKRECHVSMPD